MIVGAFNSRQLEKAMQRKGFTAADLAFEMRTVSGGRLKTTESQVYKWLRGDHVPTGGAVAVAARATDVPSDFFFEADADEDDEEADLLRDIERLPADLRLRVERYIAQRVTRGGL